MILQCSAYFLVDIRQDLAVSIKTKLLPTSITEGASFF
jgi:hypothetical protein